MVNVAETWPQWGRLVYTSFEEFNGSLNPQTQGARAASPIIEHLDVHNVYVAILYLMSRGIVFYFQ